MNPATPAVEADRPMPKYHAVNSRWPTGTNEGRDLKPTAQEAVAAVRRLYRYVMKKPFPGKIELTSGNRYTTIRRGILYVNPDWDGRGGWHELVHLLSHTLAYRLYPNAPGHGPQHESVERDMISFVIEQGWLDGKLRRPEKPKLDKQDVRYQQITTGIERWERKLRRATNALRKLRRQKTSHERRQIMN